jgi:hypothetical protein
MSSDRLIGSVMYKLHLVLMPLKMYGAIDTVRVLIIISTTITGVHLLLPTGIKFAKRLGVLATHYSNY